jgi:ribonucleotide monophosphatase NagD (HAD superfamily)
MGKPNTLGFEILRKEHQIEEQPLSKFLMVGDYLRTDILFGNNCNIDTLLVLSGNTSEEEIRKVFESENRDKDLGLPTFVIPYFAFSEKLTL